VSGRALSAALASAGQGLRLVVLNACYSVAQAQAIVEVVPCAIGMNTSIGDRAAIVFAAAFYRALGFGHPVRTAFDQGVSALLLEGIPEDRTPELLCARGVDPASLRPVGGGGLELVDMALVDDSRYAMTERDGVIRIGLRDRLGAS
jgi:hypothetical protein